MIRGAHCCTHSNHDDGCAILQTPADRRERSEIPADQEHDDGILGSGIDTGTLRLIAANG